MCEQLLSAGFRVAQFYTDYKADQYEDESLARMNAYEQQALAQQRQQALDASEAAALKTLTQINSRKREAQANHYANMAQFGASGADINSASFQAFLKSNREREQRDSNLLRLMGREEQLSKELEAQQAGIAQEAVQRSFRSQMQARRMRRVGKTIGALSEINYGGLMGGD